MAIDTRMKQIETQLQQVTVRMAKMQFRMWTIMEFIESVIEKKLDSAVDQMHKEMDEHNN